MERENRLQRPCGAPVHVEDCNGIGSTRDHFTPRAVGKLLGWSRKQLNDPSNINYLSPPCHNEKDASTPLRVTVLKMERAGIVFTFQQHNNLFNKQNVEEQSVA